jgi:hypothetical protein
MVCIILYYFYEKMSEDVEVPESSQYRASESSEGHKAY